MGIRRAGRWRRAGRFVASAGALVTGVALLVADSPPEDPPCASSEPARAAFTYTTDCLGGDAGALSIGVNHGGYGLYDAMQHDGRLVLQIEPIVDKSACKDSKGVGRLLGFRLQMVGPPIRPDGGMIGRDAAGDPNSYAMKTASCGGFRGSLAEARVLTCQHDEEAGARCTVDIRPAP